MSTPPDQDALQQLLLSLLPASGQGVGNASLLNQWTVAASRAGWLAVEVEVEVEVEGEGEGETETATATAASSAAGAATHFTAARDALLARGLVVKGKGRGGSTARATAAAPVSEAFELESGAAAAEVPPAPPAAKKPLTPPRLRAADADEAAQVLAYRHADRRKNNPEVGLVSEASDPQQPKQAWAYDPHLDPVLNFDSARAELENLVDDALASGDEATMRAALAEIKRRGAPYLQWAGKAERTSFEVDTVSLHVHERIDPMSILAAVRKQLDEARAPDPKKAGKGDEAAALGRQASLFEAPFESLPLRSAVDFYRHDKGWANRLIAGDSLQVMNSLLVKEGMAGQVQMIYIDPPYGIRYGSNFQPFVGKRDVKDRSDADLTREPEMIKAFRDTWELGIHSYLSYLRDRALMAKELLGASGSLFVQISEDNLHLVRGLLDEVFGPANFVAQIAFTTTTSEKTNRIAGICDYLIWYAKDEVQLKFSPLFTEKQLGGDGGSKYRSYLLPDGRHLPAGAVGSADQALARAFRLDTITSQRPGGRYAVTLNGQEFSSEPGYWKPSEAGFGRLLRASRVRLEGRRPAYVRFFDDFTGYRLTNVWDDLSGIQSRTDAKVYAVQTPVTPIERCILMSTDPGDLVLDPTCGSGTTAFVAEKWGRRWITCDTSRVAVTLAKQRLMTASYDYYELAYPHEGLKGGFIYKTVPHVTLKAIANNADIDAIYERLHPAIEHALAALNQALAAHPPTEPLTVKEGVRKGQKLGFSQQGAALHEWEVPFPGDDGALPPGWPQALRAIFDAFHAARQRMQAEMDRSIAAHADSETLYDQPRTSKTKLRITGPFSVEAVPFPTVLSLEAAQGGATTTPSEDQSYQTSIARSGETSRQQQWRDELLKTGIRGVNRGQGGGQILKFAELEVMAGTTCLHATGTLTETGERAVVSFGPEHGALEQRQVEHALNEAESLRPSPKFVVFCAFAFDPEAAKDIDETRWPGVNLLKAQMNTDLLTEDLKKARSSNQSFWLMGQPDVQLTQQPGGLWQVEVNGFDYFDTARGELISGGKAKIAMWSLDTDYDGRSLFPHQVFFPMAGKDEGWRKLKKTIRAELDETLLEQFHGTVSLPFQAGKNARAAVKIVDDRGIESLKILLLKPQQAP